ncbi:MAG: oxygen-independent coproporphyrinogen III oxidase [bacterium]|nr:oxygen-independent coproporphyrinogen III oxidase [bacterium]
MTDKKYINPMDISPALLEKYHRSGPRYTSYPTAPQFKPDIPQQALAEKWRETNESRNPLSIYTHFPFCKTRCSYCGCFTGTEHCADSRAIYLEALKKEIDAHFQVIDPTREIHQIALGGGTPTTLEPDQLADYIGHLKNLVSFSPKSERSIEVDPRSVDHQYLDRLVDIGFNRFSFGVQDLDPKVQKIINREQDEETLTALVNRLRNRGVEAVNLDLIYGLPGQTSDSFAATVQKIVALKPSRIALFGYAHVPWVSPHQEEMAGHPIPNPQERMELFGRAFYLLMEAGYRHIGMDHFALVHDELLTALENRTLTRNFMGYTTRRGLDLMGIGASSISSVGMSYAQNEKNVDKYVNAAKPPWRRGLIMSAEDGLRREIIMDLFCNFHLDIAAVGEKFQLDFGGHFAAELEALKPFEADGMLQIQDNALTVTELGHFFIRNICMVFDQYLAKEKEDPGQRYSKTI